MPMHQPTPPTPQLLFLEHGGARATGSGHQVYLLDVPGSSNGTVDGASLLLTVRTLRPLRPVLNGQAAVFSSGRNSTVGGGPTIEVAPADADAFGATCGAADLSDCSCNISCRLGAGMRCAGAHCFCTHTTGALAARRWRITIDAPGEGEFALDARLRGATHLAIGGPPLSRSLQAAGSSSDAQLVDGQVLRGGRAPNLDACPARGAVSGVARAVFRASADGRRTTPRPALRGVSPDLGTRVL